jgi:hypothetical protein
MGPIILAHFASAGHRRQSNRSFFDLRLDALLTRDSFSKEGQRVGAQRFDRPGWVTAADTS